MRVAIIGGAGFIGSHVTDALLARGNDVVVYDVLAAQVHGATGGPQWVHEDAEFVEGDVRDRARLAHCVRSTDLIVFLAAVVGVGQSMYEVHRYVDVNTGGIGTLLDILARDRHPVQKLIIASSMSVYGEGAYECPTCGRMEPPVRTASALQDQRWELLCPRCGSELRPIPTPEDKRLDPRSVYAITKRDQEELGLVTATAHGIPAVALRYFNCYGPRQPMSNPYTGAVAIFARSMLAGSPPVIYEDGLQTRDFVYVGDVVRATLSAIDRSEADGMVVNVGTGHPTSILELVDVAAGVIGYDGEVTSTGHYRSGDIRHCYADVTRATAVLGLGRPVGLREGLAVTLEWLAAQPLAEDVSSPHAELAKRGLLR